MTAPAPPWRSWVWQPRGTAALVLALAVVAVFTSHPDVYVADSRFSHFWNSPDFLAGHGYVWDSARGLGAPQAFYMPVAASFLALLHAVGLSPLVAERLFHATLLVVAGVGMHRAVSEFWPRRGPAAAFAAVLYAFNPYSAQFLLPTNLFVSYAVAPWLFVATVRGVTSGRPWRWAAAFALAVLATGSVNPASMVLVLVPSACALLYLRLVERAVTWRRIAGWMTRAAILSTVVSLPALVQANANAGLVERILETTERPADIGRMSSWSESWRGLGLWLTYFADGGGPLRSEAGAFFSRWWVVLATFLVPVGAMVTLAWSRWRARLLFAAMTVPALALMVGIFPPSHPSPLGRLLSRAYGESAFALSFRTGYKAGAGLMMGTAALGAVGAAAVLDQARRWRWRGPALRRAVTAVLVAVVAAAAFPFWTGRLYPQRDTMAGIPAYWTQALAWLDGQPGGGRVLVLPGTDRTRYRWGYAGDDIVDALLRRPHVEPSALWQGTPVAANLLLALDERLAGRAYVPGSIQPIAQRLGIRWVVVRNDLEWERLEVPRPADLAGLRADPALVPVASFGRPGENVVVPGVQDELVGSELGLPPVEVFEVPGSPTRVRASSRPAPLLVSGDGDAWPRLASLGVLDAAGPVAYTGELSAAELSDALEAGSPLVVTDTAQLRTIHTSSEHVYRSRALAAGENHDRETTPLFETPGAQARMTYPDAVRIDASSYGAWPRSFDRWSHPANAFDGDAETAWRVTPPGAVVGQWLRVVLREPVPVTSVEVTLPAQDPDLSRITRATVRLSGGVERALDLTTSPAAASFPGTRSDRIEVRVDAVAGSGPASAGIAEVRVPGLDLAGWLRVPDDVFRAAEAAPELADALGTAPVMYLFERATGRGPSDEELTLRRRFRTLTIRRYAVEGTLAFTPASPDRGLDGLVGGEVGASSSARFGGLADRRGALATDGNPGTGWQVEAVAGGRLTVRFPPRTLGSVDVYLAVRDAEGFGGAYSRPRSLTLRIPGTDVEVVEELGRASEVRCEPLFEPGACLERHRIPVPGTAAGAVEIELGPVEGSPSPLGAAPVKVSEVTITGLGETEATVGAPEALPDGCVELLELDGEPVPVRIGGTLSDVLSGQPVPFEGCAPVDLSPGEHRLASESTVPGLVDHVRLRSGAWRSAETARGGGAPVRVLDSSPTRVRVLVDALPGGAYLLSGQSYDPRWRARTDDRDLGPPQDLDAVAAWRVPEGTHEVEIFFSTQRDYELALGAAAAGVVVCLALLLVRRRPGRRRSRPSSIGSSR